jgi:hypothetical protein
VLSTKHPGHLYVWSPSQTSVQNLKLGYVPLAYVIDSTTNLLYAANPLSGDILIHNLDNGTVSNRIGLSSRIVGLTLDSTRQILYAMDALHNKIDVIDARTLQVTHVISLQQKPTCFAYNASRNELYVGLKDYRIAVFRDNVQSAIFPTETVPVALYFNNRYQHLFVQTKKWTAVYNLSTFEFENYLLVEGHPQRMVVDPDGNLAFMQLSNSFDTIAVFELSHLTLSDWIYTGTRVYSNRTVDASTFHVDSTEQVRFLDEESGALFTRDQTALSPGAPSAPSTTLPPGVTGSSNLPINVTDNAAQFVPTVDFDAAGNMYFAWADQSDGNGYGVYSRKYLANLTPASGNDFRANKTTTGDQTGPVIATDDNGNSTIAWIEQSDRDGQGWGIFGRRFNSSSTALDINDVVMPSQPIGKQYMSSVARAGNGDYIVDWSGPDDGDGRGTWVRRFDSAGNPLSNDVRANTSTAGNTWATDIAANTNGDFVVVWRDDSGDTDKIRFRSYHANGSPIKGADQLAGPYNAGAGRNFSPTVGIADDGTFVICWTEGGAGGTACERFDSNSNSLGKFLGTTTKTGTAQASPGIGVGNDGTFVVTWSDSSYGTLEIMARYFLAGAVGLGNDFRAPATGAVNDDFTPSAAVDGAGNFAVVWRGRGRSPSIQARHFSVGASLPSLSITNVSHFEGNSGTTDYVFTVSLSATTPSQVTVNFTTADGTATLADSDYNTNSGQLIIPPNTASGEITVTVNGDTNQESDETFVVNLSGPANATISDNQGQGTIQDDDTPVVPVVSIADTSAVEGNAGTTTATFTITVTPPINAQITLDFATDPGTAVSPDDFVDTDIPVTITANTASVPVGVTIVSDTLQEGNETFTATLSNISINATIGDDQATGTIIDDDCLFCDDFGDSVLSSSWTYSGTGWSEAGGTLIGTTGKALIKAIASPVFTGCSLCTIDTTAKVTSGAMASLYGWYTNDNNYVSLTMTEGTDQWKLIQKISGSIVVKKAATRAINGGTYYDASMEYDGTDLVVVVDGVEIIRIAASGAPSGTVGFSSKKGTATFDNILVLP